MKKNKGIGGHQSHIMLKDEWLTPPWIIKELGPFDLDPCSPINRPWKTAKKHYTIKDDGLSKSWKGRVWCNPPYGKETKLWLNKLSEHNNGIALIFARTETDMFFSEVWNKAHSVLFIRGRITFHHLKQKAITNSGAPSILIAYGKNNSKRLKNSIIPGIYIPLKNSLLIGDKPISKVEYSYKQGKKSNSLTPIF